MPLYVVVLKADPPFRTVFFYPDQTVDLLLRHPYRQRCDTRRRLRLSDPDQRPGRFRGQELGSRRVYTPLVEGGVVEMSRRCDSMLNSPLPYRSLHDHMGNQSLDMGYEKRIVPKGWRRKVGNMANGNAPDAVRDQIMRHNSHSTF